MKRKLKNTLIAWKRQKTRKPLLLRGARQVGKTFLLEEFGKEHFSKHILLDFAESPELNKLFEKNLIPKRIIQEIEIYFDTDLDMSKDLIIFDEIQLCPNALTSLKYFNKEYPAGFICASGSLLGIGLSVSNFPVGKVQREYLYPMSFFEFLDGIGEIRLCKNLSNASESLSDLIHLKAFDLFKEYLITGGLPEVVTIYRENIEDKNLAYNNVRKLQNELFSSYLDDFAKHSGNLKAIRIASLFKNIPEQLAKENKSSKKFIFKGILSNNSNYANLEGPIEWLCQAGLIHRVPICNKCKLPLSAYTKENTFILYLFDVGILGAMLNIKPSIIHNYDFGQFKGFIAENFALTEMLSNGLPDIFSWQENTSQIEFLLNIGEETVPVEVKAGTNTKAKSLKIFKEKYSPGKSIMLSGSNLHYNANGHLHIPLYLTANYLKE